MPEFNLFKRVLSRKKGREHHGAANPSPSGQPTPGNTIRDSVDPAIKDEAVRESPLSNHVGAPNNHQDDHHAAAVHAIPGSQPSGSRPSDDPIVLLNIASSIKAATDLRDPLRFTSEALGKVFETAKVCTCSQLMTGSS